MWFRLYAYGLLGSLYLDQFLWFVYLLHLGYSPAQIGVSYAAMQAVRFALDIPSSMLADRFGQRGVLVAGSLVKALSSLLFLLAGRGFAFVVAGSMVTALALALPSSVDLSYVRSLSGRDAGRGAPDMQFRLSRYMSMKALAGLGAGLLGGLIASTSFPLLYASDAVLSLTAALCALSLPRLRPEADPSDAARTPSASIRETLRAVLGASPAFWRLALLVIPLWTFSSVGTEYTQALLSSIGLHPFAISLAFAGAGAAAWLGSLLSGRIPEERRNRALQRLVWLYPAAALVRAFAAPNRAGAASIGAGGIMLARFGSGASGVLVNAALLEEAPPSSRATALSAVDTVQMAALMLLFPVLSFVAGSAGIAFVFLLLAIGLASVAAGMQVVLRHSPTRNAQRG